jgi:hypothetical protein
LKKWEKCANWKNEECQQDSSYNFSHVGEGFLIKPKESFEYPQSRFHTYTHKENSRRVEVGI